jgi:hypothetical protein
MSTAGAPAKPCIKCGQDCSGRPRSKDSLGRYICMECLERLQKRQAAPRPRPAAPPAPAEPDLAALLAAEEASAVAVTHPCPKCGSGLPPGSVICNSCGTDTRTGKRTRTVKAAAEDDDAERPSRAGSGLVAVPMILLLGCLGAAIGGAIGSGIWAAVAYNLHIHSGWIAWGVGVLTGMGMIAVARGHAGAITGGLAAIIAVLAVAGGHYFTVSAEVDRIIKHGPSARVIVTDEFATAMIAREVAADMEKKGAKLQWPPEAEDHETGIKKSEFPANVWAQADGRWKKLTPQERDDMKSALQQMVQERMQTAAAEIKTAGFVESFSLFDILWFLLAIGSAFSIGSGAGVRESGD